LRRVRTELGRLVGDIGKVVNPETGQTVLELNPSLGHLPHD
jgi:hypothetical protein